MLSMLISLNLHKVLQAFEGSKCGFVPQCVMSVRWDLPLSRQLSRFLLFSEQIYQSVSDVEGIGNLVSVVMFAFHLAAGASSLIMATTASLKDKRG